MILRISRPSFAAVVEHAGTRSILLCAVGLLMALLVLVPLAYASPGDLLWIAGIYDGADLDESIDAVTSVIGIVQGLPPGACNPLGPVAGVIPSCDAASPAQGTRSPLSVRAPPSL